MSYIGNTNSSQTFATGTDYFSGNGTATAFTLSRSVSSINDVHAFIENVAQQPSTAYTISGNTITFTSAPPTGTNNIYVRYQNLATQTIAPAQNTVSYSTLNADMQSATGFAYKNRFINANMTIDQRNAGASVTMSTQSTVFAVDRTMIEQGGCTSNTGTAQQVSDAPAGFNKSLKYTAGSSGYNAAGFCAINQRIEGYNVQDFAFGTSSAQSVTLSFWVKSSLTGTFTINMTTYNGTTERWNNQTYTINAANTWEYKTLTFVGDTVSGPSNDATGFMRVYWHLGGDSGAATTTTFNSWFNGTGSKRAATTQTNLLGTSGATFQLTGIQLEKGNTATAFDYRPFGTEFALCQRYYQRITAQNTYSHFGVGVAYSSTAFRFAVPLKATMRAIPSLEIASAGQFLLEREAGAAQSSTAVALTANCNYDIIQVVVTPAAPISTGGAAFNVYANGTTNCYLGFGAEL